MRADSARGTPTNRFDPAVGLSRKSAVVLALVVLAAGAVQVTLLLRGGASGAWLAVVLALVAAPLAVLVAARFILRPLLERDSRERAELATSRNELAGFLEGLGEAVLTVEADGRIVHANRECRAVWGRRPEELVGLRLPDLLEPEGDPLTEPGDPRVLGRWVELAGRYPSGGAFPVELRAAEVRIDGDPRYTIVARDLTDRRQVEDALRAGEKRYRSVLESVREIIFQLDATGAWTLLNPAWTELTGFTLEESLGKSFLNCVHLDDQKETAELFKMLLRQQRDAVRRELRCLTKGGAFRWVELYARPTVNEAGEVVGVTGTFHDVTERKVMTDQLESQAFYDPLTNLPNRALFMDRLGRAVGHGQRRPGYLFAVLFIDADRFKVVNDSLGHMIGDQLLIGIARRLEACLRLGDTVARLGGDEFAILMDDIEDVGDATRVAERIQKELKLPFNLSGQEVFTTASIGIALSTTGYDRPEDLLRDADIALYRAKSLGKARHEMFDPDMHVEAMALMQLEADLRRAVRRGEFRVHYQPIVDTESGSITRCEALLRWQHPGRGLLRPAEFIPLLEETGLIVGLGEWLLRTVCAQGEAWRAAGLPQPRISVNIATRQFQQGNLAEIVQQVLGETGLAPEGLELEITESTAMKNVDLAVTSLNELAAMGVHVSIDDFGTGHSSLAYLKRFPIGTLKIDRAFVGDVLTDPDDRELVTAILAMAQGLKLRVVAEGVETEEQLEFLRALRCGEAQGDFFSPPLAAEAFGKLLRERTELLSTGRAPSLVA